MEPARRPLLLPDQPDLPSETLQQVVADHDRFAREGLPENLESYLLQTYGIDVSTTYAGQAIKNPWGKASGQLSMRLNQVREDIEAGLGFVVLKTVIAQDASGDMSMSAWALKESKMVPERIQGKSGAEGWTITWKGRGWWEPFDAYLELVRDATALGKAHGLVIAPSVKYHLPAPGETQWRREEYEVTTQRLLDAFAEGGGSGPLPLEKDFSPTLAGSDRSTQQSKVREWLRQVPALIRQGAGNRRVVIGLKLFNALFDDAFQLEMLRMVHDSPARPDFLIYANRLFDPDRVFEGHRGVAYGGPDLSDRNLRVLSAFRAEPAPHASPLDISASGDIHSGRLALEYVLRGCTSFQIHTLFQIPNEEYAAHVGSKVQRALHALYFDPRDGFIVWLLHAARRLGVAPSLRAVAAEGGRHESRDLHTQLA